MEVNQNNFQGNISGIQIQQNVENSAQEHISYKLNDYGEIMRGLKQLRESLDAFSLENADKIKFTKLINEAESAVIGKDATSKVKQCLIRLKDFLGQVTASLAANGASILLNNLINSL